GKTGHSSVASEQRGAGRLAKGRFKDPEDLGFSGEDVMSNRCRLRIARQDFNVLIDHLFPGDDDEHGAVLLAGTSCVAGQLVLHVREVHLAEEGSDYVEGSIGYRALTPVFI